MSLVTIVGLDHVVLKCADVDASLAFYTDTLGLAPVRVDEWREGTAPFPSVRVTPTLIIDLVADPPHGTNVDHICFEIEPVDLDELATAFPDGQRLDHLFGAQGYASSLYITDPDGHRLELRAYQR